jgi:hypothetical protein
MSGIRGICMAFHGNINSGHHKYLPLVLTFRALHYKPEGPGSITDEIIGFFSIDLILPAALWLQEFSCGQRAFGGYG